jgi:multidrug efflux pump subunit AcrA (membrane-fusion protein)
MRTVVTAKVAALTEGVIRTMFLTKIKIATVALVLGMIALGGGMLTYRTLAAEGASPLPVELKELRKQVGIVAIAEMQEPLEKLPGKRVTVSQAVQRKVAPLENFTGRLEAVGPVALSDPAGPLKPIGVRFDMDERSYLRYQRLLREKQVKGAGDLLAIGLSNEKSPRAGTLDHFDNEFKPATGTIGVHGVLPNGDGLLLPGMFVRVRMTFGPPRPELEVPDEAVGCDQGKPYVWVVNDRNIVEWRMVRLGAMDGSMRIIEEGLRPEDRVVISGAKGLKPGDHVEC